MAYDQIQGRTWPLLWHPDADAINAPPGCLLRADNLVLDEEGIASLRLGSAKINGSPFTDTDIHSLYTVALSGNKVRLAGCTNKVYANGVDLGVTFDGVGTDISFGSWLGSAFMARGTIALEYNGTTASNWGIAPPAHAPTVAALSILKAIFATCDQSESPGFVANEGSITATYPVGEDGTANGAIEVTPASGTGRAVITKTYSGATDYFNISGFTGGPNDVIDFGVWIANPQDVTTITIMLALGNESDPFQKDYYYFDFNIGSGPHQSISDLTLPDAAAQVELTTRTNKATAATVAQVSINLPDPPVKVNLPLEAPPFTPPTPADPTDRQEIQLERRGARERKDPATNPGWTHLSALRGQFNRVGGTSARDWTTVTALKMIYKATSGSVGVCRFDNIIIKGATEGQALTGTYQLLYQPIRTYTDHSKRGMLSPVSAKINLDTQGLQVTITAADIAALDPQADTLFFYIQGGTLPDFYRVPKTFPNISVALTGGFTLEEFPRKADGAYTMPDRYRLNNFEFGVPSGTAQGQVIVTIVANDLDILQVNDVLDFDQNKPPNNIIGIAGPHFSRIFVLTAKYLYPSRVRDPGDFAIWQSVRVGDGAETALWVVKTTGGLFVGTTRDILVLDGDGTENPDFSINFTLRPLNVNSPPVSSAIATDGNNIAYQANDGWRTFNGIHSIAVPKTGVETLYKGYTRHGVSPLNLTTGRFRAAFSKGQLVAIHPEGASTTSSQVIHRHDFNKTRWYRHTYTPALRSIFREPDGTLIAGDNAGTVWQLDTGTDDGGSKIPLVAWTREDDDNLPLNRKEPLDYDMGIDTGGDNLSAQLMFDGGSVETATISSSGFGLYKRSVIALAAFRRMQFRLTGSFNTLKLYHYNFQYWKRPMTKMVADTGYVMVKINDTWWVREFRFVAVSPNNLVVKVYTDGALQYTSPTIVVTANQAMLYEVPIPRNIQGTPRVTIETVNAAGTGEVGFEVFWAELRLEPSGNVTEKKIIRIPLESV